MASIGKSQPRVDALQKVLGSAQYPGDINYPDQVYLKIKFSDKVHAIVKEVDISEAQKLPGVLLVLTARDVPVNEYGLIKNDQPVLCGPGSSKLYADRVRFLGDQIALVVAESERVATQALDLIKVSYLDLPVIEDVTEAVKDLVVIHPDFGTNTLLEYRILDGDVEAGFASSDVIIESDYETPVQEHAYLQPEAGIAYFDEENRLTVVCAGQWTHEDQLQVAHALGLEPDQVRVIYPAIGGAFGGREDMSVQIVLGLAVMKLREKGLERPVKITWSRRESIIGHHKRHPYFIHAKWGAKKDGTLVAARMSLVSDAGAYAYTSTKVLGNATLLATGPYRIPNVKVETKTVYTNNIPNGAFRGFGGPQAAFAAEMQMNKLAEKLGMDPVALRMKNLMVDGDRLPVKSEIPVGISLREVVQDCANASGWRKEAGSWRKPLARQAAQEIWVEGIGFACGYKNIGFSFGAPEQCKAKVELRGNAEIESAILYHSGSEVGQGAHTAFRQMAANALGIPAEKVELVLSDTAFTEDSGSASASRMTFMAGNSIIGAANSALREWQDEKRPAIGEYQYRPPATTAMDKNDGHCTPNFAYGYVAESVRVAVNRRTGEVRLLDVICSDDVGKAINPALIVGQVEGAIVQAQGYGLMENYIQEGGVTKTDAFSKYLIPTVMDIPDRVETRILEYPDPNGPWGARGVGEMPYIPFVPAVAAAIHDAIGVWIDDFPYTAERVYYALKKSQG